MYDMNSGYHGWAMSKNAVEAYEAGEMPKSKWTKAAIIGAVRSYCAELDLEYDDSVERLTKAELFSTFIEWSSWHHTSKFANATDFYCLNETAVEERFPEMTEERAREAYEQRRAAAEEEAREMAAFRERRELRMAQEKAFKEEHGFRPGTVAAYVQRHPENVAYRTSKRGVELIEIVNAADGVRPNVYEARRAGQTTLYGYNALDEEE